MWGLVVRKVFLVSVCLGAVIAPAVAFTQTPPANSLQDSELQRAREREKALRDQQPAAPDVRMDAPSPISRKIPQLPLPETTPAFPIQRVFLDGDSSWRFQFALNRAIDRAGLKQVQLDGGLIRLVPKKSPTDTSGVVMGANSINALIGEIQNDIISRGYTTTRVLATPQDLSSGILRLTVIPGRIGDIKLDTAVSNSNSHRATLFNALPLKSGDILNLRDIEQGLENRKRVPTADADIQIAPGKDANTSDLIVRWTQRNIPARISASIDDSGGERTGKIQGALTLSLDHPLRLNDLFYVNVGHALAKRGGVRVMDLNGSVIDDRHGNTDNVSAHYSVPFGYNLLTLQASRYNYEQAVMGVNQAYLYSGSSRTQDVKFSRIVYRDAKRKSGAYAKLWSRQSSNFIDDAEIDVQRRRTAGFELGITHREFLPRSATLDLAVNYRRGTGADDALRAPEEPFGEGTSRMKIYSADISFNQPVKTGTRTSAFNTSWHGQWNKTPLVMQDRIAIGGRYSVRGFDGEYTLAGERGWIWRNEFSTPVKGAHQVYAAADVGHVAGTSTQWILGHTLAGAALGVRGQVKSLGTFSYDAFVGTPLRKPSGFPASGITTGFSVMWSL